MLRLRNNGVVKDDQRRTLLPGRQENNSNVAWYIVHTCMYLVLIVAISVLLVLSTGIHGSQHELYAKIDNLGSLFFFSTCISFIC